jgi:hypothetical protein
VRAGSPVTPRERRRRDTRCKIEDENREQAGRFPKSFHPSDPATTLAALEKLRSTGHNITTKTLPGIGHYLLKMDGTIILGYADGYLAFISS